MTPVAVKEFFDSDAFAREFDFYNRAGKLCSHPNLLAIIGAYTNLENKNCIVTELCQYGTLEHVLQSNQLDVKD